MRKSASCAPSGCAFVYAFHEPDSFASKSGTTSPTGREDREGDVPEEFPLRPWRPSVQILMIPVVILRSAARRAPSKS
jgi:hypothetical protein